MRVHNGAFRLESRSSSHRLRTVQQIAKQHGCQHSDERLVLRHCGLAAGVDYLHPDLGGGFGPGFRVITGYDFVGDEGPCPRCMRVSSRRAFEPGSRSGQDQGLGSARSRSPGVQLLTYSSALIADGRPCSESKAARISTVLCSRNCWHWQPRPLPAHQQLNTTWRSD